MVLVMIEIASKQLPWCMVGPPGDKDGGAFGENSPFGRARDRYKDAKDLCSGIHEGFEKLFNWCLRPLAPFFVPSELTPDCCSSHSHPCTIFAHL